jgi:hypothetical protein
MYIKAISTTTLPGARDNKQIVVISLCNFMEECSSGRSIHRMAFRFFFLVGTFLRVYAPFWDIDKQFFCF